MLQNVSWTNQNALTSYPLSQSFLFDDFIVDANFVQFDNFEPVFVRVTATPTEIEATILTDDGEKIVSVPNSTLDQFVVIRTASLRFLGTITFGAGVAKLCDGYGGSTIEANIPFLPTVVKSIYSGGGVYSLQGLYGDLIASPGDVTYAVNHQNLTLNCVTRITTGGNQILPLKTINGVEPTNNSLNIHEGQLLKFNPIVGTLIIDAATNGSDITAARKYQDV